MTSKEELAAAEAARMEASNQFYNKLRISIAERYAADSDAYRAARRISKEYPQ